MQNTNTRIEEHTREEQRQMRQEMEYTRHYLYEERIQVDAKTDDSDDEIPPFIQRTDPGDDDSSSNESSEEEDDRAHYDEDGNLIYYEEDEVEYYDSDETEETSVLTYEDVDLTIYD